MLRVLVDDPADGGALLFAPAVAMIALELGLAGGLVGAGLAFALFVASTEDLLGGEELRRATSAAGPRHGPDRLR